MKVAILVVAAGRGSRFGGPLPKQYQPLQGRPVLRHCLATFAAHPGVAAIRVVIHPDDRTLYDQAAAGLTLLDPVAGGAERQDSVRLGLESLDGMGFDVVLIHDAARPAISRAVIDRVLQPLRNGTADAVLPGLPVADTIKRVSADGSVEATVPRVGLWRAQTPQGFRFVPLLAAHRAASGLALTDDAAVAEHAGLRVRMVEGDGDNGKITLPADLLSTDAAPVQWETRTGQGFDVHAFAEGDHVTLCGVNIPHSHRLSGHSDADVAMHALTDAIYGTIAAGDIGHHFPPSQSRWKGCDSAVFLRHAHDLLRAAGGRLRHVDLTIICEAPKIGPHRLTMAARLAEILDLPAHRISVKATTTEQLGFTGRREGIATQAMVTVQVPDDGS
ncbi:bifunctional 2-C-methyl-D-erythritol 4-phosphate cytidylyltransferase/2-C-methyl-D-erythritol 2,4-cyclodiphosphate synthase [Insolitispirillum peregrinum]|uniref:Bifunctional enzyme IspD/IspF n=1 Tax=Insolitispirillum peregrinum TaxID=80876 RepID=A0A1N7IYH1_9PROT|nr:bifunctional 2-C-methyl-D-erythritol 4-phosphate cytidylyltransferase/2-C-methyl-D-erythritol 2,4-cyclodiphosphate synthase [Insolitispirillum peregrinum]SIS42162.1 2-C-methyl-D-erythritol 2,4-cyclodiphosphate synthase [Insolitispirillum peregrinum]